VTRLAAVILTFWAGSLWTVCAIAAPVAFAVLDDRHAAGRVAATLFEIETWLGAAAALMLFACASVRRSLAARLGLPWLIAATAAAPLVSELVLSPMMAAARAANDMARFGMLHGVSALLFLAAALGALVLVLRFNRPAE
jgi:Domain of unknown function (DUF4149)